MQTQLLTGPEGQALPAGYRWLIASRLLEWGGGWWSLLDDQQASESFRSEFKAEVADPNPSLVKDLQPFARVPSSDDVAGFVIAYGRVTNRVLAVHLTYSKRPEVPGWPEMTEYASIWEWIVDEVIYPLDELEPDVLEMLIQGRRRVE